MAYVKRQPQPVQETPVWADAETRRGGWDPRLCEDDEDNCVYDEGDDLDRADTRSTRAHGAYRGMTPNSPWTRAEMCSPTVIWITGATKWKEMTTIGTIRDISDLVGGCDDCSASLTVHDAPSATSSTLGVRAVTVTHRQTCPWAKRQREIDRKRNADAVAHPRGQRSDPTDADVEIVEE